MTEGARDPAQSDRMTDPLSRRGFSRIALAGAASLWLPSVARADVPPPLSSPSFALSAQVFPGVACLEVLLFLRSTASRGAEVPAHGVWLAGHLEHDGQVTELPLEPKRDRPPMPRSGPVVTRRVFVPTEEAVRYGAFVAPGVAAPGGALVRLRVRTVRFDRASHADARALEALDGRALEARVRRRS
ncbi:MAG TPA: hypothetical protein DEF51_42375 [Myxococcales bacterium]|nr:hypothetical protein [Myxococcales bacterium]